MRIAQVIGRLTLSRAEPSLRGGRWLLAIPMTAAELQAGKGPNPATEGLVVYDDLGADQGMLIAVSESAEAAAPFYPNQKPLDAYNAAILDRVEVIPL